MTPELEPCRLCGADGYLFTAFKGRYFYQCDNCRSLQLATAQLLDTQAEKNYYLTHENDVEDLRYQKFVSPITDAVLAEQLLGKTGLDYGAGPGPVIAHQLSQKGFDITLYDPFFHNNINALDSQYDFIISCEVIEHFHQPAAEFARLRDLLKPGGSLYCMTEFFSETVDFGSWYYKNDPTHVFFYHENSLPWITQQFAFAKFRRQGRLVVFSG